MILKNDTHHDLTVGADPEFFVRRTGHFIPACEFRCGTKQEPMKTKHGSIQVDGLALEVNVLPAKTKSEFLRNVSNVMADLMEVVHKHDPKMSIVAQPTVRFSKKVLDALPMEAKKLGCEPDFNAYTGQANPKPDADVQYRTGAGHIHLGWTEVVHPRNLLHQMRCRDISRQLDYYVGLPSLLWDKDSLRRNLYGQAGSYRPKLYGLEYRVLSNRWTSAPALAAMVYDQTHRAFDTYWKGQRLDDQYKGLARELINHSVVNWPQKYPELAKVIL